MGKISIDISEDSYSKLRHQDYELSILLGVDSFAYALSDERRQIVALREYSFEQQDAPAWQETSAILSIIQNDKRLQDNFRSARIGLSGRPLTLVPSRLYNPLEKHQYLLHLSALPDHAEILADDLGELGCRGLYALPAPLLGTLRQAFPGCRFMHLSSALLQSWRKLAETAGSGHCVCLHLQAGELILALFSNGAVQLCNTYPYQSAEDFLYFVLLGLHQQELDNNLTPVYISGKLLPESAIYTLLARYFRQMQFMPMPAQIAAGDQLSQNPGHFYADLFSLMLAS